MGCPLVKITVVTAVYNGAETIEDTLRSVALQTHPDIEHIVVDGASTDATLAIVERYRNGIARLISEPDRGVYDAMNKGLSVATGEIVGFLNADDVFATPTVLSRIAETLAPADIDASYANLDYVSQTDPTRIVRRWRSTSYRPGLFERGWMPAHPTFYAKRHVYDAFGGFDLSFKLQADFELTMRLMRVHDIRTTFVPEVWIKMRTGGMSNNSVRNVVRGNMEAYQACRKHCLQVPPWFMLTKVASRLSQFTAWSR